MSQLVTTRTIDDLDGRDGARSVEFGLEGVGFKVDLHPDNADTLYGVLAPFIRAAERTNRVSAARIPEALRAIMGTKAPALPSATRTPPQTRNGSLASPPAPAHDDSTPPAPAHDDASRLPATRTYIDSGRHTSEEVTACKAWHDEHGNTYPPARLTLGHWAAFRAQDPKLVGEKWRTTVTAKVRRPKAIEK